MSLQMRWSVLLSACALAFPLIGGETVTVDNVDSLTNELDRLNRLNSTAKKNLGDVVILKKGFYDVSKCHMLCDPEIKDAEGNPIEYLWSTSHVAVSYLTLKGETDDPRDVVIYGDRSERILYMWSGSVQNLTISNGCTKASDPNGGGGILTRNQGSRANNIVVTRCKSYKNGGGITGGIYCTDCDVEHCETEANGGGITTLYTFTRGRIRYNTAKGSGGGACNACLNGTLVEGNVAGVEGGGVKWDYDIGSTNCTIIGNVAALGGGVASVTKMCCSVISNNVAVCGGGVYNCKGLEGCRIVHNLARALVADDRVRGGGAFASDSSGSGSCIISNAVVAGNAVSPMLPDGTPSTKDCSGGGGESVRFVGCRIYDNFAKVGASLNWGSAVDCVISNNVTPNFQHVLRGTTELKGCDIFNTRLVSPGQVSYCKIRGLCDYWELPEGANVYTNGIFDNTANLYKDSYPLFGNNLNKVFSLTNCLVSGNHCAGLIIKDKPGSPVDVVNCTFTSNTIAFTFGGFDVDKDGVATELHLKNTIISGNYDYSSTATPKAPRNFWPRYGSPDDNLIVLENCLIGSGWFSGQQFISCTGLIESDNARFMRERDQENPFALRTNSPARNKGTVEPWMANATDIRGEGFPRVRDSKVDLGCYQCWDDPPGLMLLFR